MKILHRYILRELIGPFVFSLCLLTFILFMRHMVILFPKIAGKGLGWPVIIELLLLTLPFILALVLPMATLVAVIMAFGRLAADNEIVTLQAVGVGVHRLLPGPMAAAMVLMLGAVLFNDRVLPESNHRYKNLLVDIAYLKPTLKLREGEIMDDFPGISLLVNRIDERGRGRNLEVTAPSAFQTQGEVAGQPDEGKANLFGIIITDSQGQGIKRTIIADSGLVRFSADQKDAILTLYQGEIQEVDSQKQGSFQRMFFSKHQIRLPGAGGSLDRGHRRLERSDREMSLGMIAREVAAKQKALDSLSALTGEAFEALGTEDSIAVQLRADYGADVLEKLRTLRTLPECLTSMNLGYLMPLQKDPRFRLVQLLRETGFTRRRMAALEVEYQKKFSIPFASLVFVLLGIPMGIVTRRGGIGVAISISMGIFLVYWVCLISGETLADRLLISPFWAMWTPNWLFSILAGLLYLFQMRGTKSLEIAKAGFAGSLRSLIPGLRPVSKAVGKGRDKR